MVRQQRPRRGPGGHCISLRPHNTLHILWGRHRLRTHHKAVHGRRAGAGHQSDVQEQGARPVRWHRHDHHAGPHRLGCRGAVPDAVIRDAWGGGAEASVRCAQVRQEADHREVGPQRSRYPHNTPTTNPHDPQPPRSPPPRTPTPNYNRHTDLPLIPAAACTVTAVTVPGSPQRLVGVAAIAGGRHEGSNKVDVRARSDPDRRARATPPPSAPPRAPTNHGPASVFQHRQARSIHSQWSTET